MTHYHAGQRCPKNLCADVKDPCGVVDPVQGRCTLFEGHPDGVPFGGVSPGGHLYFPLPARDSEPSDSVAAERIGSGRLSSDDTGEVSAGALDPTGHPVADLDDVLSGGIPSEAILSQDPAGGYPYLPYGRDIARWRIPDVLDDASRERLRQLSEDAMQAFEAFRVQSREMFTASASAGTLVRMLIERAKTAGAEPDEPLSADDAVATIAETLRATGLLLPAEIRALSFVVRQMLTGERG